MSAFPVNAPIKLVDVTEVKPARVVLDEPKEIEVVPIVVELFDSLLLAIEPANIVLVTVALSPVVTIVPVVAGNVIIVPDPAVAVGISCTDPDVDPGSVKLDMPVRAKFADDLLRATDVVPM